MNLRDDMRQKNTQMNLDFHSAPTGEARQARGEETKSFSTVHAPESPASTHQLMEEGEDAPARLVQQGFMAVLFHFASLNGPHVVEGCIHFGDEVKAVEDVQGLGTIPPNHLEVGLPHVRADELDFGGELFA